MITKHAARLWFLGFLSVAVGVAALSGVPVLSPAAAQEADGQRPVAKVWDDLLHYIRVAQVPAATASAREILSRDVEAKEIYQLAMSFKLSQQILIRGLNLPDEQLKGDLQRILALIEKGYRDMRSDDAEIQRAIELLKGSLEQFESGKTRLLQSGEYALPRLISVLSRSDDRMFRARVISVLSAMGKEAVRGISVALQAEDQQVVRDIAGILATIGYPHAAPRLKEALDRKDLVAETRQALRTALITVAGQPAVDKSTAEVFYEWADKYYRQAESMMPDPRDEEAFVWYWKNDWRTVEKVPVPRPIFDEIYTMRLARLALKYDETFYSAVPLWLTAFARREVELDAGGTDPLLSQEELHARDYILSTSPKYLQQALSRAMADQDTRVVFMMIEGLAQTQGSESLVRPIEGGAMPLVQAMSYPDRQVRYLAAVSLARALPDQPFAGYQMVMPVLGQALRQTGRKAAMLVGVGNELKGIIRDAGYEILEASEAPTAVADVLESAGVDVFIAGSDAMAEDLVRAVRQQPTLTGAALVVDSATNRAKTLQRGDRLVFLMDPAAEANLRLEVVSEAIAAGLGQAMEPQQSAEWAVLAARAIETVGQSGNKVYNITRTLKQLQSAVGSNVPAVQMASADALATMNLADAQRSIVDLAIQPQAEEQVRISAFGALSRSLRKFGNLLTDDQSQAVVSIVMGEGSRELRTAASQALGAMNLASDKIKTLMLQSDVD